MSGGRFFRAPIAVQMSTPIGLCCPIRCLSSTLLGIEPNSKLSLSGVSRFMELLKVKRSVLMSLPFLTSSEINLRVHFLAPIQHARTF
jgi:hypothetical protein